MRVEAFHVSAEEFEIGQVVAVPAGQQTRFQARLTAGNATQAEDRLEAGRPALSPSRLTTQYAFADVYDCQNYGASQYPDQTLHFYRVLMVDPARVPMAMVNVIKNLQGATAAQITSMVNEYWNPTVPWQFYEYLAGSMTILEMLPPPNDDMELIAAQNRMGESINRAGLVRDAILAGRPMPDFTAANAEDEDEAD